MQKRIRFFKKIIKTTNKTGPSVQQTLVYMVSIYGSHRPHVLTFTWLKISLPFWEPISWRQVINDVWLLIPIKHRPSQSITRVILTLVLIAYRQKWE